MPTESLDLSPVATTRHPLAVRRILRLALGTSLCLGVTQLLLASPLAFIAPLFTLMMLSLPIPAPGIRKGMVFILALLAPMVAGLALLPLLHHARWSGILLVALALFYSFLFTTRGGNPVLGMFMTVGLTVVVTIGSVSIDVLIVLIQVIGSCAAVGMVFVWFAHALLPDPPREGGPAPKPPPPEQPPPGLAARRAFRGWIVVFPLALVFMFMSASPSYTVVMIKAASMGQQANTQDSRALGRSLLASTLWGGLGAVIIWQLLAMWPSLVFYVLLFAVTCLFFGRRIFQGPGMHPKANEFSYALVTLLIILGPAVTTPSGDAGAAFYTRLGLILLVGVYGTAAVAIFDRFFGQHKPARE
ncbi:MAG: DUF2955 domain-containing protein [Xanthomonadales bacterium]|jgi:hypothetical protein|nr:DUF2955 domain-containing protein [Xanthomonadales bacterium]